jgi:hypothetical protein
VTERWLESGAAWSGMRPPAVAGRGVVAGSITSSRPQPTLPPCRPSPFRPAFVAESHSRDALIVLVGGPQVNPWSSMARAAGGHRRPWGGHPGGGHRVGAAGQRGDDAPLSRCAGPEAEDAVDLIGVEWRRRGDAVAGEGGRRRTCRRTGVGRRRRSDGRRGIETRCVGTALHTSRLNRVWFRQNQLSLSR